MRMAYDLASRSFPAYSSKFSRKDFTLHQLFACLVVKEHMKRTYRGAEALLRDSDAWLRDVGLERAPDHNTLCRAARFLLAKFRVDRLLDQVARWADLAGVLGLWTKPLAIDSTTFESHHVSRHYERRCHQTRKRMREIERKTRGKSGTRADTVRKLPKLAIGVSTASHLILSAWTGTGAGSDHPHFEPVLFDAWRRVPQRRFTAALDAGYDSERNHDLARREMGIATLIPSTIGRPSKTDAPPTSRWRRAMRRLLATKASRKRCGYNLRYQVETAISMIKRNLGSALAGKTATSRKRDMRLKVLTHCVMIV